MKTTPSLSIFVSVLISALVIGCSKSSSDNLRNQKVSTNGIMHAIPVSPSNSYNMALATGSFTNHGVVNHDEAEQSHETTAAAHPLTVTELASRLSAADFNTRFTAGEELFKLGSNAAPAVAAIGRLLEVEPDKVHDVMLRVLEHCPSVAQSLKPTLAKYLTSSNINLRISCARTLWVLDNSYSNRVRPVANESLREADAGIRVEAASLLWRMDHDAKQVIPVLTSLLSAPTTAFDYRTIRLLGQIGPSAKKAVPALQDWLKSRRARGEGNFVTNAAVVAIQQIQAKP